MLASAPDDNYSSSDESELSVGWDAGDENDPLPSQGTHSLTGIHFNHDQTCRKSVAALYVHPDNNSRVTKSRSLH